MVKNGIKRRKVNFFGRRKRNTNSKDVYETLEKELPIEEFRLI